MAIMGEQSPHDIEVLYLEDVVAWMGPSIPSLQHSTTFLKTMQEFPTTDISKGKVPKKPLMAEWLQFIANFVWCIHERCPPTEAVIVFLPTYCFLEDLHTLLLAKQFNGGDLGAELHVLHSSVDTADALSAMRGAGLGKRSIFLASNVAESSVTIPHLAWVIDPCLHNLVQWDPSARKERGQIAWAAKAQSEQRMGRTGRTCRGRCARILPQRLYDALPPYERPQARRVASRMQAEYI
jgi:HrpA-like RNA helicase